MLGIIVIPRALRTDTDEAISLVRKAGANKWWHWYLVLTQTVACRVTKVVVHVVAHVAAHVVALAPCAHAEE